MTRIINRSIPGLLAVLMVIGCSQGVQPGNPALNMQQPANIVAGMPDDPCAMVLMPSDNRKIDAAGGSDSSIPRYQKAVSRASEPLHQLERLGWAFVEKARDSRDAGYYKLAELTALCMEDLAPDSPASLLLRGHVLHNLHSFKAAEDLARRLTEQRGLWFDFALLGDVLMERGALNEAIDVYQRVVDQRPGPQSYARVAQLRWLKGDLDGALEMMSLAARATSPRTPEAAAWVYVRLALMLMQADELPAADAVLTRALSLKPEYPPALHARGRLLLAQDQPRDAVPLLMQAVQADPLPEFRWTLYEALRESGQYEAAGKHKTALMQYGAIEDRRTFALFLATTGHEPETALRLALQELEQREDVFTLDAVAWALSSAGLNAEAHHYSQRALDAGTRDARLYLHAGVIAARTGDGEQALELLNKAKTTQQMLLPSERQQLANEFAAQQPQIPTRIPGEPVHRTHDYY